MKCNIQFAETAQLRCDGVGPLPCELSGHDVANPQLPLNIRFAADGANLLPQQLHAALLLAPGMPVDDPLLDEPHADTRVSWRLRYSGGQLRIAPAHLVLHEDARALVAAVVPARQIRWRTRMLWNIVFVMMRSARGRALLLRRYRR